MPADVVNFQEEVIEKSRAIPVLVDFWAPWCGPCRALGPVLEKLSRENGNAWTLAKVNTDVHQEISRHYGIRGIPAVKLFVDGQVVDEFTGALPEHTVKKWLDEALPTENKQYLEQAEAALHANAPDIAEPLLRQVLAAEPDNSRAQILLARLLVFRDPEQATELARRAAAEPAHLPLAEAIQTVARLIHLHNHPDTLPDDDAKATYLDALQAVAQHDFDTALTRFIDMLQHNRYYDDDGTRKAGIALFTLLGPNHPLTCKHRRTFDMWLY